MSAPLSFYPVPRRFFVQWMGAVCLWIAFYFQLWPALIDRTFDACLLIIIDDVAKKNKRKLYREHRENMAFVSLFRLKISFALEVYPLEYIYLFQCRIGLYLELGRNFSDIRLFPTAQHHSPQLPASFHNFLGLWCLFLSISFSRAAAPTRWPHVAYEIYANQWTNGQADEPTNRRGEEAANKPSINYITQILLAAY